MPGSIYHLKNTDRRSVSSSVNSALPPAWMVIVLAAASVLLAMSVLLGRLYAPVAALAGLALLIALFKAAAYTRQHPEWIVLPIFLTFARSGFVFHRSRSRTHPLLFAGVVLPAGRTGGVAQWHHWTGRVSTLQHVSRVGGVHDSVFDRTCILRSSADRSDARNCGASRGCCTNTKAVPTMSSGCSLTSFWYAN